MKELAFFVGDWEATKKNGSKTHWTFKWTPNENVLENVITVTDAAGEMTFQNRGMMGWDAGTRRITNRCFNHNGDPMNFIWEKRSEGVWDNWQIEGNAKWVNTVVDDDSWRMEGSGGPQLFSRVKTAK